MEYVDAIELAGNSWEFDLLGVFKDNEGRVFTATDSGCSCPMPWENLTEADYTEHYTWASLERTVRSTCRAARNSSWADSPPTVDKQERFLNRLRKVVFV